MAAVALSNGCLVEFDITERDPGQPLPLQLASRAYKGSCQCFYCLEDAYSRLEVAAADVWPQFQFDSADMPPELDIRLILQ